MPFASSRPDAVVFGRRKTLMVGLELLPRIRHPEPHPAAPLVDHILTSLTAAFFVIVLTLGRYYEGLGLELLSFVILTTVAIPLCKAAFGLLAPLIGTKVALAQPRNVRKFCDQSWQFVIHASMTLYELWILGRPQTNWTWWNDPAGPAGAWVPGQDEDAQLRTFYLMQLGIWFYTAFSCRFVESRHKDYFVMYTHHVVTITLVALSFAGGYLRIGVLVLLLHDSSDVITDLLKMVNYMGLDQKSGLYLTELLFVINLGTWIWLRLWLFPTHVISSVWTGSSRFWNPPSGFDMFKFVTMYLNWALLSVLFIMHIYWFGLFVRIAVRLLKNERATEVAEDVYEEDSGAESDEASGASGKRKGKGN